MTELCLAILDKLNWFADDLIKPSRSGTPDITCENFIKSILDTDNIPEAAILLGVGSQTLNRLIDKKLVPVLGHVNGGNETWKYSLLLFIKYKSCISCKIIQSLDSFCEDNSHTSLYSSSCKDCRKLVNKKFYDKHKDIYHKTYIEENRADYSARNAKRRAAKLQRTPAWADLNKIKEFYNNCPKGWHVDHVVPLQGVTVCGLHVENNLQYLTAADNLTKSNKHCECGEIG